MTGSTLAVARTSPAAVTVNVGVTAGVLLRPEPFGALAYVPARDHFYALDAAYASLVEQIAYQSAVATADRDRVKLLAELGICTTANHETPQRAFFGRSLVGDFARLPIPSAPMVVNCFTTSRCPLRCRYCHADDLMIGYREDETDQWLDQVAATARSTDAMVAVVTGGEPLYEPSRARKLIAALAETKAVVVDTSGAGDFDALLPTLLRHRVHVRVSLDSADARINDAVRPINRRYLPLGASSFASAHKTIASAVAARVPCSVQTVVTKRNQELDELQALRDHIVGLGVTNWVLHVMVPVGKGATKRAASLLPDPWIVSVLQNLVKSTAEEGCPLDIRVTGTHRAPNAVLLVNARGELSIEDPAAKGAKKILPASWRLPAPRITEHFRAHVDLAEHASRYLNGTLEPFPQQTGEALPPV